MKYARATWRIFLAWLARRLHLPKHVWEELDGQALLRRADCAFDFSPVQVTTRPRIIGWHCGHMSITAGGARGTVNLGPVTTWCGCDMQPVYA